MSCALGIALLVAQQATAAGPLAPAAAQAAVALPAAAAATTPAAPAPAAISALTALPDSSTVGLGDRYRAARLRRNVGLGLAAVGVAALATGAVVLGSGLTASCNPDCYETVVVPYFYGGIGTMAAGVLLSIPGVVLALQGQSEMTDVQWRRGNIPGRVVLLPTLGGLFASYSGAF